MKRNFGILLGILFYSLSTSAQIVISQGNETLYIEVDGITNLKKLEGYPTPNWYSYRRENLNLDMTIRPHMTIVGGSCFPQAYHHGLLYMTTYLVTSWNVSPSLPDLSPDGPVVDSIHTHHASGTTGFSGQIDFSRHYKSQHSLKIILSVFMSDEYVPSCLTPQTSFLTFFLLPELTPGELARTAQANEAKSDQDFWKQGNCNACNKKGVPGFSVSTVTLLPGFSDQDYSYTSLGPDIDFSRYFANPGIIGMFGNGWNFVYEQELLASKKLVQYQNGTGANEMYTVLNDSISPYTYLASFSNRKRMRYYPGESRFEIFDPGTKLFSDLQLYATENDTMRFHLSHIRDMNGNLVTLTYNGQQKISAITDAAGRTTSFQ